MEGSFETGRRSSPPATPSTASLDFKIIISTVPSMWFRVAIGLLCTCLATCSAAIGGEIMVNVISKESIKDVPDILNRLEGIIGVVNTDVITPSEVREMTDRTVREARQNLNGQAFVDKQCEIIAAAINELVTRTLILQKARSEGLAIPEAAIDDRIQQIIDTQYAGDRNSFLTSIRVKGFTLEKFRVARRNDLLVEEMRKRVVANAGPADAEQAQRAWLQKLQNKAYIKIY